MSIRAPSSPKAEGTSSRPSSDELKDDLIVALRALRARAVRRAATRRVPQQDGRPRVPVLDADAVQGVSPWSPLRWDRGVEQTLQRPASRRPRLGPGQRRSTRSPATELVYDFSVPGLENFWAGTGVLAHNTYGARMRPHDGRAIPTFLRQALTDRPITVFGDGQPDALVLLRRGPDPRPDRARRVRRAPPGQHRQPRRVHPARARRDRHLGHELALRDRARGAAHGRPQAAPARHRARTRPPRLGAEGLRCATACSARSSRPASRRLSGAGR